MRARDAARLLGGYAAGNLTADERAELFSAALADQTLFDALADEQALRDLLADPAARGRLLAALGEPRRGLAARLSAWIAGWRERPVPALFAAGCAVATLAVALVVVSRHEAPRPTEQLAQVREAAPAAPATAPVAATAPVPHEEEKKPAAPVRMARVPAPRADAPMRKEKAATPEEHPPEVKLEAAPEPLPVQTGTTAQVAKSAPAADQAAASAEVRTAPPPAANVLRQIGREDARRMRAMAVGGAAPEEMARTSFAAVAKASPQIAWRVLAAHGENRMDALAKGEAVHTGQPFRLEISSPVAGRIQVMEPDGALGWKTVASGEVGPEKPLRFPAEGTMEFSEAVRKVWRAVYTSAPGANATAPPGQAVIAVEVVRP